MISNQLVCAAVGAVLAFAGFAGYPPALITSVGDTSVRPLSVTQSQPRLRVATDRKEPGGYPVLYTYNSLLQIAPDTAAMLVTRNVYTPWGQVDFEDGSDIFVFRSLDELPEARPITCTRSGIVKDADFSGADRYHVNYGMFGGFVPHGAKLDGKPHPHAGTGFGTCAITSHPVATNGLFSWQMPGHVARRLEIFDFSYDGKIFSAKLDASLGEGDPLPIGQTDWTFVRSGLGNAIPDGADLLLPSIAAKRGSAESPCGLVRWRRTNGKWRPVDFQQIADSGKYRGEPSVVRLSKTVLLFCVRDDRKRQKEHPNWTYGNQQDLDVWLSEDNGRTWTKRVEVADVRMGPVTVGRTCGGSVFLVSNPGYPEPVLEKRRNLLTLWPLSENLDALGPAQVIRNAKDLESGCGFWQFDHPVSSIIRLADGKLHSFLSYRVRDHWWDPKTKEPIATPSADAGAAIQEVTGPGEDIPVWEF